MIATQPGQHAEEEEVGLNLTKNALMWYEGGDSTDKVVDTTSLASVPTTAEETIGPFDTVWTLNRNDNSSIVPTPTSWEAYTFAGWFKVSTSPGRLIWQATEDRIQLFSSGQYGIEASNSGYNNFQSTGGWDSVIYVKSGKSATFYLNGVAHPIAGGTLTTTGVGLLWDTSGAVSTVQTALIDEVWTATKALAYHNNGTPLNFQQAL